MITSESWKPIPGYEGLYEASDLGRIRSLARVKKTKNRWGHNIEREVKARILKQRQNSLGYFRVNLSKQGFVRTIGVHRLVCAAFHGYSEMHVAHQDGNPSNNSAKNLRWASCFENMQDKFAHGTNPAGERNPRSKLTTEDVAEIRRRLGAETGKSLAEEFGVSQSQIVHIKKGRSWAA